MTPVPGRTRSTEPLANASRRRSLVHGTAWMMVAQGGRLLLQIAYFVLITRMLGVTGFGQLAASIALVSIFVPFAAWGSGNVLVMKVVREPGVFSVSFGNALLAVAVSSLVLVPLAVGLGAVFLPRVPLEAIVFIALGDLCLGRFVDIAAPAFQAFERLGAMTVMTLLVPAIRFAGVLVFTLVWQTHAIVTWTLIYLTGSAVGAVLAFWLVARVLEGPTFKPSTFRGQFRLGGYFAVSASATTIYGDIDKTMLGRLSTFDATGLYAAADRAVSIASMPITALLAAAYPRFFRAGMDGIKGSRAYARRLLPSAAAYGLVAGVLIYLLAPLAPHVLGSQFKGTVAALRWLAVLPVLRSLYYLPADALTGAGAQGLRTVLQLSAAGLNVVLNIILIPAYSWRGAAWSTIVSLTFLAVALWIATTRLERSATAAVPSLPNTG